MTDQNPAKDPTHKIGEYGLISKFPGYHAREDVTTLPLGSLITPSKNVVIKTSGRVALVAGYTLDGTGSTVIDSGILSNFDFTNFKGDVRNLRAGFLTNAGNDGKLQYRYVDATGVVNWVSLKTALTNVRLSYTSYWDTVNLVNDCLWVDGSNNVFSWNGAVTTFASGTTNKVISLVGNSALLTSYGAVTGTSSFINGYNNASGTALLAYIGLTVLPTNGQTLVLNINAAIQTITFVTVIGSTAGNVLIGVDLPTTITNLLGLLQNPATSNSTQVAFSGANQIILGYITFASNNNTVTKQGTNTWAQEGFSATGSITIAGTSYTYTGGGYSNTLFGISSDVSGSTLATIIHQTPVTTALSSMTGISATYSPTVIGNGRRNQVYLGAANASSVYISKVNDFTNYSFTTPVRVAGEGWLQTLDAPATAFVPLESRTDTNTYDMYISEGTNTWSIIEAIISSDLKSETLEHIRMKVAPFQAALSNKFVSKMKNHIIFIGHDNVANFLGYLSYQYVPETVDFSYPIIDDMNSYDFTDGAIYYYKNYIYIAIPKSGIIRIYNMTDQTKQTTSSIRGVEDVDVGGQPWFWESPVGYPVSGFYVTPDKGLCGHSYATSESYQLFTGGDFNGQQIDANVTFSYDDAGDRTQSKGCDKLWVEGYIAQNTILTATVTGDLDAFANPQTVTVNGDDNTIVAYGGGGHSLGERPLGSSTLGGSNTIALSRPAWFHVAKTFTQVGFYIQSISFFTRGVDLAWELICYGTNNKITPEGNNDITQ